MPIHDWTRVPSGLFHHFHQDWSIEIARTLNRERLPKGVSALVAQRAGPTEPDVLAIESRIEPLLSPADDNGGVLTVEPPVTQFVRRTTNEIYAVRANRIVVTHHLGRVMAIIEIVSPGNKDSRAALRNFVEKAIEFLRQGVHVLIVDLFPPTPRDPNGVHKVIWDEIIEEDFEFPEGKDRTLASYAAGNERVAYVETLGVGDELREMPLFLTSNLHVKVPLETTYQTAWESSPEDLRIAVETGEIPETDTE